MMSESMRFLGDLCARCTLASIVVIAAVTVATLIWVMML